MGFYLKTSLDKTSFFSRKSCGKQMKNLLTALNYFLYFQTNYVFNKMLLICFKYQIC